MGKPEVTLENYPVVYEHYGQRVQNHRLARLAHRVVSRGVKLRVSSDDGAENSIKSKLDQKQPIVFAPYHVSYTDHEALAKLPYISDACRGVIGTTVIGAKAEIFDTNPFKRFFIDNMSAEPVWRKKDVDQTDAHAVHLQALATRMFLANCINHVKSGKNLVLMDNGTVADDPLVVEGLLGGLGFVVASLDPQPSIVPIGIYKQFDDKKREVAAHIHLGAPSDQTFETRRDVTAWLLPNLQGAVDLAYAHAQTA